jgi:hypothetical protein
MTDAWPVLAVAAAVLSLLVSVTRLLSIAAIVPAKQPLLLGAVKAAEVLAIISCALMIVDSEAESSTAVIMESAVPPTVVGASSAKAMIATKMVLFAVAVLSVVGMTGA